MSAFALGSFGGAAFAQHEERTLHYRFLPRPSILLETGGFPAQHNLYHIRGTFDLQLTPSPLTVFPPVHVATFENVDASGIHPHQHRVIDVDEAFNLSGLHGGELLRHRRVFRFRGTTGDGSTVELHARILGPWLYLRGSTTPPPHAADFLEYDIKAIARRRPHADFNDDGVVDGADLAAWTASSHPSGGDFLAWQRQLGETAPTIESLDLELDAALAAADSSATAVPEPGAVGMAAIAVALLCSARRRGV
jgi:hypothetical protein